MCRPADVVFCRASCLLCCVLAQATHHRGEASCWHVVCSASSVLLCLRSLCVCRLPFVGRPGRAAIAAGAATSSCPRPAAVDSFSAAERQQGGAVGVAENSKAARERRPACIPLHLVAVKLRSWGLLRESRNSSCVRHDGG